MKFVKEIGGALLGSKKFVGLLTGLLVGGVGMAAARFGLDPAEAKEVTGELLTLVVPLVSSYLVGQGLADVGKEGAKVAAKVAKVSTPNAAS